jgi:simple sugar transport system substrate-binding protein
MKRRTFNKLLGAGLVAGAAPAIIGRAHAAGPLGVGFMYVGPIGDLGWNYQHDLSRKELEKHYGDKIKTTYVENVPEGPDAERVLADLASKGNSLIFATSFGYMNPTIKVAQKFPKVHFEHATGYKRAANVATYNIRFYESRYVEGIISGMMSKSGKIGYICSVPIPEVVMGLNAYIIGMRTINPKATIRMVWINSWYDPGKEGDAAKALFDQGCDIVAQHTDSTSPLQVAQQRGLLGFGEASDMYSAAPKAQLTSPVNNWAPYYIERTKAVLDGTWKSGDVWGGFKAGMMVMAPYKNMPDNVAAAAKAAQDGIASGAIDIYKGPIKDQSGAIKVAAGSTLDDKAISGMNWLAEGVEGQIPK